MYDYELTLIGASEWARDDSGNYIPKETQTTVLCDLKKRDAERVLFRGAGRPEPGTGI